MTTLAHWWLRGPTSTAHPVRTCWIDWKFHKWSNIARPKVPLWIAVDSCICSETETCSIQVYVKYYTIKIWTILCIVIILLLIYYIIVKLIKRLKRRNHRE